MRLLVVGTVGFVVSGVFLWLATRHLQTAAVRRAVTRADPLWGAAAVVAMMGVYILQARRWQGLARPFVAVSLRRATSVVLAGVALSNAVPGRPGDLFRAYWLSRESGIARAQAVATVVVDRALDVAALVVFLVCALPFVPRPQWLTTLSLAAAALAVAALGAIAGAFYYSTRSRAGRARAAAAVHRSKPRLQLSLLVRAAAELVDRRRLSRALATSISAWIVWSAGAECAARAAGIQLRLPELLLATAVVNLGTAIPSSPGFVGTYQWLCVATLRLFHITDDHAFAFSLLLQASWFVPSTLGGLIAGLRMGRRAKLLHNPRRSPAHPRPRSE